MKSTTLVVRLLAAGTLALCGACSVSASGQIPCADDSSCPADYPVCQAGKCVQSANGVKGSASVQIVGVPGKAATDPVRGTVDVQVVAKASSGVQTLTLDGGGKSYSPDASSTPPVFVFVVDTTKLTDGAVQFTSTLTPGDSTQAQAKSGQFTLTVDNTAPTLTIGVVGSTEIADGALVAIDVTSTEPLASVTGTISGSTTALAQISAPTGNTYHFGYAVTAADAAGAHSVSVNAADPAGNPASKSLTGAFNVRHPFAFGALTVNTGHTVNEVSGALSAASVGTVVTTTVTVPSSANLGTAKPVFKLTSAGGTTRTLNAPTVTTGATNNTWTTNYTVVSGDNDGIAGLTVAVTDTAGNTPTPATASLAIDKSAPIVSAITGGGTFDTTTNSVSFKTVANKRLQSATISSSNLDATGVACQCDGGTCNATTSVTPTVSCTITVTHGAAATPTVTLALTDTLGNSTPATAAYRSTYTVVAVPTNNGITGSTTINAGTTASITPSFSNGTAVVTGTDGTRYTALGGPITVSPSVDPTTYSLTVTNAAGTTVPNLVTTAVVHVLPAVTIHAFSGPQFATVGTAKTTNPITLTVDFPTGGTASVAATSGSTGLVCTSGAPGTSPATFNCLDATSGFNATTVFTATVTGATQNATATFTVTAANDPADTASNGLSPGAAVDPGSPASLSAKACTGCTPIIEPGDLTFTANNVAQTVPTAALQADTAFTLVVTNKAGASHTYFATQLVNRPKIDAFAGPQFATVGTAKTTGTGISLTVTFSTSGTASVAVVSGSTNLTCAATTSPTTSPVTFSCSDPAGFTATTVFRATLTLGTGANATDTVDFTVTAANDPASPTPMLSATTPLTRDQLVTSITLNYTYCSGCTATITNGVTGTVINAPGTSTTTSIAGTTTFRLTVTNAAGATGGASFTVNVLAGLFSAAAAPGADRFGGVTVLLPDGTVLIAGGRTAPTNASTALDSFQIYDPGSNSFTTPTLNATNAQATMHSKRYRPAAVLLPDGRVYITGGIDETNAVVKTADIYDPANGGFLKNSGAGQPADLGSARWGHTATVLPSGKVLLAGGFSDNAGATPIATLELFNPATPATTPPPVGGGTPVTLTYARGNHTATAGVDGRVLILGGVAVSDTTAHQTAAEVVTETAATHLDSLMKVARVNHTATLLDDGRILVVGGTTDATNFSEVISFGPPSVLSSVTGPVSAFASGKRFAHTATPLPFSKVLIAGGTSDAALGTAQSTAEIYTLGSPGTMTKTGGMGTLAAPKSRAQHGAVFTFAGNAVLIGGDYGGFATAETFDPN